MSENEHEHEHEENEVHFVFGSALHENVEQWFDQQQAHNDERFHSARRFLMELDEDQLRALRGIVLHTLRDPNSGFCYIGSITTLLDTKHNICLACGKDHDKNLQDMAEGDKHE